ncbi:MAG: N-acyl-D-amino-acid deacylase [Chloroflexi bacterium]|jgi:N-acyl-D-amino-acid deacylase|nr:N-acyl-D-amino-acid deacylase [Chloroflexota bacterium]
MDKIEIKNATIIDGLGGDPYIGNLYLNDGKITAITHGESLDADKSIDATGKTVTPGFIDLHTHSDLSFLLDSTAQSKVRQGVTMELIGNCGMSTCAPLIGESKELLMQRLSTYENGGGLTDKINWTDYAGYIEASRKSGATLNVAFQIGHATLRSAVIGQEDRPPTADELNEMKRLAGESLDAGALGFSTGLFYAPGYYARTDEVIAIAEEAGKRNKLYSTHQRDEGASSVGLFVSLNEAIEIGRRAECKVQISHVKCDTNQVWGKADKYLALLESTVDEGLDVRGDQYPYPRSSTSITGAIFPRWSLSGGREETLKIMANEDSRGELIDGINVIIDKGRTTDGIMIARYVPDESFEGKNITEISESMGTTPAEAVLRIYQEGEAMVVMQSMDQKDVDKFAQHPLVAVASDGSSMSTEGVLSAGKPHPRSYGTNPTFIQTFVNEKKIVSLQEAIRKMTSLPASRLGLTNRGRLVPGYAADVVIMQADKVKANATFLDPHQYPSGITHVIVNGEIVIKDEEFTGKTPGTMITDFSS